MTYKKIICLVLITCFSISMTGCKALDMMVSVKEDDKNDMAKVNEVTDFELVEDSFGTESFEEAIQTITIDVTEDEEKVKVVAYYEDENGYIVPVHTEIPWEEGIAKATLKSLIKGDKNEQRIANSGLHGVLPEGTEIKGMAIKEGLCRIDFSNHILNTSSYEQEENMINAITYTLTEFPAIESVELLVEGQALQALSKGYNIDTAFVRENINLVGSNDGVNYTVYYKAQDTEVEGYYVPITFSAERVENPAIAVVETLFAGVPENTDLNNQIPYGVNLKNMEVTGDVATLNLGVQAVNLSQNEYEEMHKIVVLCLSQFEDIKNVDYKIEGLSFAEAGLNFTEKDDVAAVFNQY